MASTIIHMAIGNELNKTLKRNNDLLILGSIAPDLSKLVNESRSKSHFSNNSVLPDVDKFVNKYRNHFDDDFVLGYYIHLYTDYLWFKYFLSEVNYKHKIKLLNGEEIDYDRNQYVNYLYNDYTDLNHRIIDKYNLDVDIFDKEYKISNIIEEIPIDKIKVLLDKSKEIIENSKEAKNYIIDIDNVNQFIDLSIKLILAKLKELNI